MNIIIMTKQSVGTVTFIQTEDHGLIHITDVVGIESDITVAEVKDRYRQYYSKGFRRNAKLEEKAQKAFAPKPQKVAKPKKTATKRFIFCKESKQIWSKEYNRKKAEMMDQIRPYFKDKAVYTQKRAEVEVSLKDYMKSWEASMADEVNEMIEKKRAEQSM